MCTLTWTTRAKAHTAGSPASPGATEHDGYALWFNRDERLTRAPEIAPRLQVTKEGVRYLAPEDSEAGGTWISTNEHGLTVALLNGYTVSRGPARTGYESRGALVRNLAGLRRPQEALGHLTDDALKPYRPAVVFIKGAGEPALVARWDGRQVVLDAQAERQLPLTSSSYEQDDVSQERRAIYERLVLAGDPGDPLAPDPERLEAFQRFVDPEAGPTAFTPTMQREDAGTRSQCFITVSAEATRLMYRPGPPHSTDVSTTLELARVRGPRRA